jgi:hypothetical protein
LFCIFELRALDLFGKRIEYWKRVVGPGIQLQRSPTHLRRPEAHPRRPNSPVHRASASITPVPADPSSSWRPSFSRPVPTFPTSHMGCPLHQGALSPHSCVTEANSAFTATLLLSFVQPHFAPRMLSLCLLLPPVASCATAPPTTRCHSECHHHCPEHAP